MSRRTDVSEEQIWTIKWKEARTHWWGGGEEGGQVNIRVSEYDASEFWLNFEQQCIPGCGPGITAFIVVWRNLEAHR